MAMDPVNKKAIKKDFKDRKDQDIDNDGDVDSSDEYLHKRRKAVSKAIKNVKESFELEEKVYSSDYNVGHEKSQFGGYRPHVTHKKTGKTMYLGQTSYKKPEHAKGHAAAYLKGYEQMGDRTANRHANEYEKANKQHVHKEEVELEEKAESQAQAIAARIALKHKREGTKPKAGTASADMMKMSEKDLEDYTKAKKGAPEKVKK